MPDLHQVAAHERETVRVFAVEKDLPEAKLWSADPANITAALGTELEPAHMEVIDAGDLAGMGLAQFLIDGDGIGEEDLEADRQMLDTAGPVLVLIRARAFVDRPLELTVSDPLVPLGAYAQAGAAPTVPTQPRDLETAAPTGKPDPDAKAPRGSLTPILILVGVALVLMAVLILPKL